MMSERSWLMSAENAKAARRVNRRDASQGIEFETCAKTPRIKLSKIAGAVRRRARRVRKARKSRDSLSASAMVLEGVGDEWRERSLLAFSGALWILSPKTIRWLTVGGYQLTTCHPFFLTRPA